MLRIIGATVVTAPSSSGGARPHRPDHRVARRAASPRKEQPPTSSRRRSTKRPRIATGEVNAIPVTIRRESVDSAIGEWTDRPSAVRRQRHRPRPSPTTSRSPREGEDSGSDLRHRRSELPRRALAPAGLAEREGVVLRVALPRDANPHKGRLLALRFDPGQFRLVAGRRRAADSDSDRRHPVPWATRDSRAFPPHPERSEGPGRAARAEGIVPLPHRSLATLGIDMQQSLAAKLAGYGVCTRRIES